MKLFKYFLVSIILGLLSFTSNAQGQMENPTEWRSEVTINDDNTAIIELKASLKGSWHLYSQRNKVFPTEFNWTVNENFELVGKVQESPTPHCYFEELFGDTSCYFKSDPTFTQSIKTTATKEFDILLHIYGQACLDDGMCVLVEENLIIHVAPNSINETNTPAPSILETENTQLPAIVEDSVNEHQDLKGGDTLTESIDQNENKELEEGKYKSTYQLKIDIEEDDDISNMSLWLLFILSFLGGLAAILTPCVFPMIPMTVSFFLNNSDNKAKAKTEASFFGFSIIGIYVIIGTVISILFGPNFANWLSTHWIPNILFFLIFVIFAASFFGMFEITLPSWLVNKSDSKADKGGFSGAFFMAFTLVLVSFSCTGPIVGAILVESAGGKFIEPIVGMLGFSLAFALPFTIFAFSPSLLSNLPKSGGWLNSVKVVLGFIELGLGLKFLSVADQTYHWGILPRELYLSLWIIIFTLMGIYLLGKIKFPHDSPVKKLGVARWSLALITFTFSAYLISGLFGQPLKFLSGYLPPIVHEDQSRNELCAEPKYAEELHMPHGLSGFFEIEQAIECSKKIGKPIFIDFTGHGCVNCREIEANVWSDARVKTKLQEDFIMLALYVDDKTELPESEWVLSTNDGKLKKTIGKINADIQIHNFNRNSQPQYAIIDAEGNSMTSSTYKYDLDVMKYIQFLDKGLENYREQ